MITMQLCVPFFPRFEGHACNLHKILCTKLSPIVIIIGIAEPYLKGGQGGQSPPLKLPQRNIYIMMYISIINNLQLHHDRRKIEWTSTALYPS